MPQLLSQFAVTVRDYDEALAFYVERLGFESHEVVCLGRDVAGGQLPQHVVPAGVWKAAVPRGERFAFCGCTVAPGFEFADFEMPGRAELLARFPRHADIITRLTRH